MRPVTPFTATWTTLRDIAGLSAARQCARAWESTFPRLGLWENMGQVWDGRRETLVAEVNPRDRRRRRRAAGAGPGVDAAPGVGGLGVSARPGASRPGVSAGAGVGARAGVDAAPGAGARLGVGVAPEPGRVTLQDVANRAGVSLTTASR